MVSSYLSLLIFFMIVCYYNFGATIYIRNFSFVISSFVDVCFNIIDQSPNTFPCKCCRSLEVW